MLALTRDVGEGIQIGDSIVVKVTRLKGRHVILGISAPPEIPIKRLNKDGSVLERFAQHAIGGANGGAGGAGGLLGKPDSSVASPISLQRGFAEWNPVDDSDGLDG